MEEENFNWAEQLLGVQEKKDIKNSNAFKTLIDNNIDTNELTGHEKETEAGVINLNYKDDKEKEIDSYDYTKGLLNFVKDMPEETVKALMLASLNGVDVASNAAGVLFNSFTKIDPAMNAAFNNGDGKKFKQSLNLNIKKFSDYLGTQKEEVRKIGEESKTSSKAAEFVAMIAQDTPYAIPIYKKLKNIGVPNWMALPVSYGMGAGIAFDDDATLFLNSEQVQEFKKMVVDLENSSEDKIFNTTFRMAEGTGLGVLTAPIVKALKYAKNNIPKFAKPQSTITVGGGASAGAIAENIGNNTISNIAENK
jgi:DNA-binding transcriptional regulator YiaG